MPPEPPSDSTDNCLPCDGENIIALSSDDSDEEADSDHVYTLLGQQEPADGSSSSDEDEDNDNNVEEIASSGYDNAEGSEEVGQGNLPPAPRPSGSEEIASVWNTHPPSVCLPINAEKAAEIQAAMANFTLPPSAVPAWAANIPEEQWKQGLLQRLHRGNVNCNCANCSNNSNN